VHGLISGMLNEPEKPFTLRMDNTGAIYLVNSHAEQRTKDINI
jgi:hypothetical protein